MYINCKGKLIDLTDPKIMGILNLTPDSFYDGGKYNSERNALLQVEKMLNDGATFIDVGGSSTRPNSKQINQEEEIKRVIPILEQIMIKFPDANVSIDTYYSIVAQEAVSVGACMVNDVSGGGLDADMFKMAGKLKVPYVLSHTKGDLFNREENPTYEDLISEINHYLSEKIFALRHLGVTDIILDPGFGFAKNLSQNYTLLKNLNQLAIHEMPLIIGVSRKSMLYKKFEIKPEEILPATSAAHMVCLRNGANILRAHDVKEAKQVVEIYLETK